MSKEKDCQHEWEYGDITLDVAPDGINFRDCKLCGLSQKIGPFADEGWRDSKPQAAPSEQS